MGPFTLDDAERIRMALAEAGGDPEWVEFFDGDIIHWEPDHARSLTYKAGIVAGLRPMACWPCFRRSMAPQCRAGEGDALCEGPLR